MDAAILPILLFGLFAFAVAAGMLIAGSVLGPSRSGATKEMPYESGMDPIHDTRRRFDVRFHLVAIAFLIFDVELLFLYPWAVASRNHQVGIPALLEEGAQQEAAAAAAVGVEPATSIQQSVVDGRLLIFAEVMLFIGLLTAGFVYAWRKGVFRWR